MTESQTRGRAWPVGVAVALPLLAYIYVNHAKLGNFFGVPYDKQDLQLVRPERRAALAATGNSLLSLNYFPTNIVAYFRPDGIAFRSTFPWITFAHSPDVFGGVHFDNIEPLASVTVTSLALVVLAAFGAVAAARAVRQRSTAHESSADTIAPHEEPGERESATAAVFRVSFVGATVAAVSTLVIGDLFERYAGDFVPILVVGGALGLAWLGVLAGRRRGVRRATAAALVVLAVWSCCATLALTLIYQREYSGLQSRAVRAGFFGFQLDVNDALGFSMPHVRRGATLPVRPSKLEVLRTTAPHGELFVVGHCKGLFISSGTSWQPIEERSRGQEEWAVRFGPPRPGVRVPLWSAGTGPWHIIWARWLDTKHIQLEYEWSEDPFAAATGQPMRVDAGREYRLYVVVDRRGGELTIAREATSSGKPRTRLLLWRFAAPFATARGPHLGRQPDPGLGATEFDGKVRRLSITPLCDRLTR